MNHPRKNPAGPQVLAARSERNRALDEKRKASREMKDLEHEVADPQRQLAEVTRERDTRKAMVKLHDALNDRRRAIADNERREFRK